MKKLRLSMVFFAVLIALPLAFVAMRTYGSLNREAQAQVRYFAEQLLDEIEAELAHLVRQEENRAVDEYQHSMVQGDETRLSPLTGVPAKDYILGYFQNNPDGSFQTPLVDEARDLPSDLAWRVTQLELLNEHFNRRKRAAQGAFKTAAPVSPAVPSVKKESADFAERFLKTSPRKKDKTALGQQKARVEEITAGQAMNLARQDVRSSAGDEKERVGFEKEAELSVPSMNTHRLASSYAPSDSPRRPQMVQPPPSDPAKRRFHVEVAPLQTVVMDTGSVFVFRRIVTDGQIYRQGVVLLLQPFLDYLLATFYEPQPIARYTQLSLNAADITAASNGQPTPADAMADGWIAVRTFPAPFNFLTAQVRIKSLPPSPTTRVLTLALVMLGVVMVVGLVLIYQNARAVLDLSERRARFVSTVTHELKTPLTTIRMYIEMLQQGIAATPEREHEYMGVLAAESSRLSGLINNVLELSRLEKQSRRLNFTIGDLSDVLAEVEKIMAQSLAREGFDLAIDNVDRPVFAYDRDVLVQVLVNLMENSIKFGRHQTERQIRITVHDADGWVRLLFSDTGPGIPRQSLKKVFDDFYRVNSDATRDVGGTGIGLALVKKLIHAMGGRVWAETNPGPGCTIVLMLPANRQT